MRWKDFRKSDNVVDRRGSGGRAGAKMGGLGVIIMAVIAIFVFKQDPQQVIGNAIQQSQQGGGGGGTYTPTPEEEELAEFVSTVLAYTEEVWDEAYPSLARGMRVRRQTYVHPKLVLFRGQVRSACGAASSAMGPFYCPGDNQVYIDLGFYDELKKKFKAPGDFAQAYVIAHEVGHHIQNLLGISGMVHRKKREVSEKEYNQLSVRLELQADFFAGVWARRVQEKFNVLEHGDVDEGIRAAGAVGDDTIQKRARGYVVPDSFTHGTAEQRINWFRKGFESGDPLSHDPFRVPYDQLDK